jgi:hypothetical protein
MGFRVRRRLLEKGDTFTGDTAQAMSMVYRYGWPHTIMPVRMVAIKRAEKK